MSCCEFIVLYTIQKKQKTKKWHDGVLKTSSSGNKATLYDDKGLCLDHIYIKFGEIKSGKEFESDRYLITVEEEKISQEQGTNFVRQEEVTKPARTNVILTNPARCHLPVGLKRKHIGFQGPREISKKLTLEQKDELCEVTKSQQPTTSVHHLYATSPLFSTMCIKETLSYSATFQKESSETNKRCLKSESTLCSKLPGTLALSHYPKLKDSEEMNISYSTDAGFTTVTSISAGCSHNNGTHENKRSKEQILALLDGKSGSNCSRLETLQTYPQEPTVDTHIAHTTDVSDCHTGFPPCETADTRLVPHHDMELLTDCDLTGKLYESLGRGSSWNSQGMQQKCEEKEDSSNLGTSEQTKPRAICTTVRETVGDNVCKGNECFIKTDNPSKELLSTTDNDHFKQPIAQVELDTINASNFADRNFDLLGKLISEKIGTTNLNENEILPQRSLNMLGTSSESIPALSKLKGMEVHQAEHIELEAQSPAAEEKDLDIVLHGEKQTEIKCRTLPNTVNLSEKHSSYAWKKSIHERKEPRSKTDNFSVIHPLEDTISVLKSLAEHSTAIESLEKLNVQKHVVDCAINGDLEQAFNKSEAFTGGMSAENEDLKYCGILSQNPGYCSPDYNAAKVSAEPSSHCRRNSSTEFPCLAEAAKYVGMFEEHLNDNCVERVTVSERPLRTLQAAEFKGYQVKGSATSDTVIRIPTDELELEEDFETLHQIPRCLTTETSFVLSKSSSNGLFKIADLPMDAPSLQDESNFKAAAEDVCAWYKDDQVPVDPVLSSYIPDWLNSSASHSDFEPRQWNFHKVRSPVQQVSSEDAFVDNVLRCSNDSNVGERDYSVPNHQLRASRCSFGNETADSFVKDGESRIQPALRLRSPLVTLPATNKSTSQALPSNFFSSVIEPHTQCSAIYTVNSRVLCDSSEKYMNNNCNISESTDPYINKYSKPIDLHSALQSGSNKWLKYQISTPTNPASLNDDDHSEENHMFKQGNEKAPAIQENIKESLSVQLIKDELLKQNGSILAENKTCSATSISSICKGYSVPRKASCILNRKCSNITSLSELHFPKPDVAQGVKTLKRQVTIPATFLNAAHYKDVFIAVITEHLNVLLYDLSQKFHRALSKVDMSQYSSEKASNTKKEGNYVPLCQHQQPAKLVMVKKEGPNKGRLFYTCDASKTDQCKFFKWFDLVQPIELSQKLEPQSKLELTDARSLGAFIRSQNVPLYCECQLHIRKASGFQRKQFYRGKWKESLKDENLENCCKTKLYLWLSRKEHSSVYSKDDLWVISKTLKFDPLDTFIACSVFYGPSSTSEIELLPLKGYSPSNWPADMVVHALFVGNVSTELTSLRNLQENVHLASLPLMPHLLKMPGDIDETINNSARQQFVSPTLMKPSVMSGLLCKEKTMMLAMEMIQKFHLNTDQGAAFRQVALMMAKEENSQDLILPVTVIHGVYGAGKSYLLAVMILFLVRLFEESEATEGAKQVQWKLLISASTNVAVDRVLLGLLELGFDKFIRVGSIRKIAKSILPYGLHAGSDTEEIRELQALLKDDLTPVEKVHVRRCIEQHKLGRNRAMLKEVQVVGATCAACPFQCMNNLSFPLVLLDECSQITEPTSLLPIARFGCAKLILVGDPKQLPPTIQGSESVHDAGLEQTLFDRMCLMGHKPIMLRTQYRCHPTISAITNELFYNGSLIDGVSTLNLKPLLDWLPTLCFYNVKGHEQMQMDGSYHNLEEATFTAKLIQSLIASGIEGSMIGVITLYKSQMFKLCGLLNYTAQCDLAEIKAVQVSTVDAFQGAEKEIIVLSCVRTRQVGFIDSEKRMNVALSRGKRHLLIVGNLTCLRNNRLWEKVIHHCEGKENGLKHAWQCEPELEKILKSYDDQKLTENGQKEKRKLKSRSRFVLPEGDNQTINTSEISEVNETQEM
ncbi:protein ZGRF1-like [Hypanus sabinus]|uniref:protein ZGRF1-like n=1 Tax=Hypanus sabinus TaxID=79690 RepID=UPI0028C387A1|nr:protein ZGRF1-like [Hypanus sabinus]